MILVVNKITLTWHLYFRSFLLSLLGKGTHFGLLRRPGGLEKLEKFTFAAGCCHTPEILFKIFCARLTWNHLLILLHLVEISSISLYQFIYIYLPKLSRTSSKIAKFWFSKSSSAWKIRGIFPLFFFKNIYQWNVLKTFILKIYFFF